MHLDINVHHYFHNDTDDRILSAVGLVQVSVDALIQQGNKLANSLDDILTSEGSELTALGQLATAVKSLQDGDAALQKQLADALSGATLPTPVQAKVDAALAASKANSDKVGALLASLAPAGPTGATGATGSTGTTGGTGGPVGGVTPV